jgi:4-amino-4-deoxy-L-arabinose transferase-like glycosyltransferase
VTATDTSPRTRPAAAARRRLAATREAFRRVPRAALVCALVAVLNAAAWAILLPPLEAHDEQAHVYYVQYLAETGKVPRPVGENGRSYTDEQNTLVNSLHLFDVVGNGNGRPPWTDYERDVINKTLSGKLNRESPVGGDEGVGSYPPLYYATMAIPYKIASSGTLIDRILFMRLASALYAGVAVFFVFMFLRELMPRQRWAWPVGALAVAFQPVFAYISGAVNPDVALAAASAALFYLIARAFRRGIDIRLAASIGLVLALGVLAKITMIGFVPGVALTVLYLTIRDHRQAAGRAARVLAAAAGAAAVPIALYCLLNLTVWDRPLLPGGSGGGVAVGGGGGDPGSLGGLLSYAWQDYFPRLPWQYDWFVGFNGWDVWFKTFWGTFGWGDYMFSLTAYNWLLYGSILLAAGAIVVAIRSPRALLRSLPEILSYAVLSAGIMLLLAYVGYSLVRTGTRGFEQGRYLLPLMAPFAAFVALGVSGFGQRVGRYLGVLVVIASFGFTFYAHLLTVARFYA